MLFLPIWLVGWAFGEVMATAALLTPGTDANKLFLGVWLCMWTLGGFFAIFALAWMIAGREIVSVNGQDLVHVRTVSGISRSKEYTLSAVSNLRASPQQFSLSNQDADFEYWGLSGGSIAFDYGKSTHRFGAGLNDAEAEHVVSSLKKRFGNL
ncbi:MAG: hypothetical protein RKO25_07440 [Candidatus Contendobacter sp.]|nr:hypothetical protein [Candidatus Contendobacter sp.]